MAHICLLYYIYYKYKYKYIFAEYNHNEKTFFVKYQPKLYLVDV